MSQSEGELKLMFSGIESDRATEELLAVYEDVLHEGSPNELKQMTDTTKAFFKDKVRETHERFQAMGYKTVDVDAGCVLQQIKFANPTPFYLRKFFRMYFDGTLAKVFQPIVKAMPEYFKITHLALNVVIYVDDFWRMVENSISELERHIHGTQEIRQSVIMQPSDSVAESIYNESYEPESFRYFWEDLTQDEHAMREMTDEEAKSEKNKNLTVITCEDIELEIETNIEAGPQDTSLLVTHPTDAWECLFDASEINSIDLFDKETESTAGVQLGPITQESTLSVQLPRGLEKDNEVIGNILPTPLGNIDDDAASETERKYIEISDEETDQTTVRNIEESEQGTKLSEIQDGWTKSETVTKVLTITTEEIESESETETSTQLFNVTEESEAEREPLNIMPEITSGRKEPEKQLSQITEKRIKTDIESETRKVSVPVTSLKIATGDTILRPKPKQRQNSEEESESETKLFQVASRTLERRNNLLDLREGRTESVTEREMLTQKTIGPVESVQDNTERDTISNKGKQQKTNAEVKANTMMKQNTETVTDEEAESTKDTHQNNGADNETDSG